MIRHNSDTRKPSPSLRVCSERMMTLTCDVVVNEWPACSGADTKSIIDNQISAIDEQSDIVTLTVRGNDVGFGDCANVCISKVNRIPDCSETLDNTGNLIANDLLVKLDGVLSAILTQVIKPGFKLYFSGYPNFLNV